MPSRANPELRELINLARRTGEPSLADLLHKIGRMREAGRGKAVGSYTEKLRLALWEWMGKRLGSRYGLLTFQYRLYRHKVVTITGERPTIYHSPLWGKGSRGFVLEITILSIDGVRFKGFRREELAWNRIIGKEQLLALPEPGRADKAV